MMYSFSRLLPAAGFAATALVASVFVQGLLPQDTVFGLFLPLNMGLGALLGFVFVGRRAGQGYGVALGVGLTAGVLLLFWAVALQALWAVFEKSLGGVFPSLNSALSDIADHAIAYAGLVTQPYVLAVVGGGGVLCALLAEAMVRVFGR